MALSRKYYELIAKEINELYLEGTIVDTDNLILDKLINNLAMRFEEDNANFDNVKFLQACLKNVT
jgi:hypothetical protein